MHLPGFRSREVFPFGGLFNFQSPAFRKTLVRLGQGQPQNTIHAGDAKASPVGAVRALHADHLLSV